MRFVALLVAAVIAVVAGVAALQMSSKPTADSALTPVASRQNSDVATVQVLVARQPIEVGAVLDDAMIEKQPWPSHLVLDGFITSDSPDATMAGKVARASFQANEPITRNKIANPNDPSFLAAALPAGMRAVTVATDAISGVAGYVFPGDRVDIIITHNIPNDVEVRSNRQARAMNKPDVSEVLVPNVRVLAVNVRQPAGKEAASSTPSSITLEVREEDVQSIRLAEKVGALSLALRPLKDDPTAEPSPTRSVMLTGVKIFGGEAASGVRIVRGAGEKQDTQTSSARNEETKMDSEPAAQDANP